MGLADREYVASRAPSRYRPAGGRWSITTWMIVLCAGVYFADAFLTPILPPQWIYLETRYTLPQARAAKAEDLRAGAIEAGEGGIGVQPVHLQARNGTIEVAQNAYRRISAIQAWLYFSTSQALISWIPGVGIRGFEVWRFVGYQFCHYNLSHLIFNMLALYFFGGLVESYLGRGRFLAFYLLCGIAGALLYLVLNAGGVVVGQLTSGKAVLPGLLVNDPNTPLVGASACVMGILVAAARLFPGEQVLLFYVIPMRLRTLAWALLAIALGTILFGGSNAGGEAAHLGGAIAGFWLISSPRQLDAFAGLIARLTPGRRGDGMQHAPRPGADDVDRILAKVKERGLGSLSEAEKEALRQASRRS